MLLHHLVEAIRGKDETGPPTAWRTRLIRAGTSKNRYRYSLGVLHEAAPLFEGVRALARSDEDHVKGVGHAAKNIVGWFSSPKPSPEGVDAIFNISEAAGWLKTMLWDAWERGKKDIIGLSIVAEGGGDSSYTRTSDGLVRDVQKIAKVHFVDVVVNPSAGGGFIGLAEADDPDGRTTVMMEQILKLIEALDPVRFKEIDTTKVTEAEVIAILEAIQKEKSKAPDPKPADPKPDPKPGDSAATIIAEALSGFKAEIAEAKKGMLEELARQNMEHMVQALLSESDLPKAAQDRVLDCARRSDDISKVTATEIQKFITAEAEYLNLRKSWSGPGSSSHGVCVGADSLDKWKASLFGLVEGVDEYPISEAKGAATVPAFNSIREAYITLTGDDQLTFDLAHARNLREATIQVSTFTVILGDALRRSMQKEFRKAPYDQWRKIADVVPVQDFRTNYRPQLGGFSDLVSVAETVAYAAFTTAPGEFVPRYSVTKYGRLQVITLEAIANDDVGLIRRMPQKMGRAAARTLNAVVWTPITTNAAFSYTGTDVDTLFHANHGGNLGSSALSASALLAARKVMMKQTEQNSSERLNIGPKYLCVPVDLEESAYELCYSTGKPVLSTDTSTSSSISDNAGQPNFLRKIGVEPLVIPHATDTNNWYMAADKADIPIMEVGFLGGRQEPELFVQDLPNVGSMFDSDQITYKVRHIYGVCAQEWRGLYGSVVA